MNLEVVSNDAGIDSEVEWGLNYRQQKKKKEKPSIFPKTSPINIKLVWQRYQLTKHLQELELLRNKIIAKPPPKAIILQSTTLNGPDRATFTKKEYINFLATPRKFVNRYPPKDPIKLLKRKFKEKEQCSARLVQLSRPTKLRVYHTWKEFYHQLSINRVERLNELMHTDNTLDPKYARCCFKLMAFRNNKAKSQELKKRKKHLRKERNASEKWLNIQIRTTANLVVKFLQNEPLLTLNFKQMLLSNVILEELVKRRILKFKPIRNSKNLYRQSIVDIVDQLAVWMDTIVRYVDIQHLDAGELTVSPSLESLLAVQEEEESEEEEEEEEEEKERYHLPPLPQIPEFEDLSPYLQYAEAECDYSFPTHTTEALVEEMSPSQATLAEEKLPIDQLELLIAILSNSPDEFLDQLVDSIEFPDITYRILLSRLQNLSDLEKIQQKEKRQAILNETMTAWAKANDPEKVNEQMMVEIQNVANILAECLKKDEVKVVEVTGGEDTDVSLASVVESTAPSEVQALDTLTEETTDLVTDEEITQEMAEEVTDEISEEITEEVFVEITKEVAEAGVQELLDEMEEEAAVKGFLPLSETTEEISEAPSGVQPEEFPMEISQEPLIAIKEEEMMEIERDIPSMIPRHQPSRVFEHAPDTICCLTLKVWATWLLEVANNAQAWSKWLSDIIIEVRRIASIIRGDVKDAEGKAVLFYKEDWIEFSEKVDKMIVSWRQYSMHVKDLTDKIIRNFRGKKITCCPKCLEDNLIVNIPVAHDISQQLAEAMNTANYWRRWLDSIVMETKKLTSATVEAAEADVTSSYGTLEIIEVYEPQGSDSEESLYEIEELDPNFRYQ